MSVEGVSPGPGGAQPRLGIAVDVGDLGTGMTPCDLLDMVSAVEGAGLSSLWLGESYASGRPAFHLGDPLLALALLAGRTTLRLGTGVLLLNAWPVQRLAYEAALLDQLCAGRLTLGVAAGGSELAGRLTASAPLDGSGIDGYLRALRQAWAPETTPGPSGAVVPGPYRPGGPQLLVGGRHPAAARRAAVLGDGWYGSSTYGFALVTAQAERYRAALAFGASGQVAVNRFAVVRKDDAEAHRVAERYLLPVLERYLDKGSVHLGTHSTPHAARDLLGELALVGSPDTVRRQLSDYARIGVDSVQLRVRILGMPWPVARATLDDLFDVDAVPPPCSPAADPRRRRQ
jgi:alkanesulfonate monooxygenase SsuD/methylene tetrahydromethanopterin reductase-like flavin-dependent oxidoreductase (luciferase family)